MSISPDIRTEGASIHERTAQRTSLGDYLAQTAIRTLELVARDQRIASSTHPHEFPHGHVRAEEVQDIIRTLTRELHAAGYTDEDIVRVEESLIGEAPSNPLKPRTSN